jgi:DNA-binding response OmpR family regulator
MNVKASILLAEDDPSLGFIIKDNLEQNGYQVSLCTDGQSAIDRFEKEQYHLAILDIMLPKRDGFSVAREIRNTNEQIPILFLTARIQKEDKIEGFKTGADDYITKPFSIEELLLRIEVFLKRSTVHRRKENYFRLGRYTFDYNNLLLSNHDTDIYITQKEADILKVFCENTGSILKREEILMKVWGDDDYFMGRSMDVFISKLRKRFKDDPRIEIINLHGVGFRMVISDGDQTNLSTP